MDSTCTRWKNITVLKFYDFNYVYAIFFFKNLYKKMEKKVRNGLKNGSIFTQEASYLLTTLFRKWFSCEFLPLWSVNLLCIALDDSANQIAEGRVFFNWFRAIYVPMEDRCIY